MACSLENPSGLSGIKFHCHLEKPIRPSWGQNANNQDGYREVDMSTGTVSEGHLKKTCWQIFNLCVNFIKPMASAFNNLLWEDMKPVSLKMQTEKQHKQRYSCSLQRSHQKVPTLLYCTLIKGRWMIHTSYKPRHKRTRPKWMG